MYSPPQFAGMRGYGLLLRQKLGELQSGDSREIRGLCTWSPQQQSLVPLTHYCHGGRRTNCGRACALKLYRNKRHRKGRASHGRVSSLRRPAKQGYINRINEMKYMGVYLCTSNFHKLMSQSSHPAQVLSLTFGLCFWPVPTTTILQMKLSIAFANPVPWLGMFPPIQQATRSDS